MRFLRFWLVLVSAGFHLLIMPAKAATNDFADRLWTRAAEAYEAGRKDEAFKLLNTVVETGTNGVRAYFIRGRFYGWDGQHEKAARDFDEAIKLEPKAATLYQNRGIERFKLGRFKESAADFDTYLEIAPHDAPNHWQRGIACYYAGRYADGRKQFELHQTVNPRDVENAVWHFLCVARGESFAKARSALIGIEGDPRVPMMTVYALFAGRSSVDDVLAAAKAGDPSAEELKRRLFYAHLYLGLYHEAQENESLAREHIVKAADEFKADHFMWDVARVHANLLRKKKG